MAGHSAGPAVPHRATGRHGPVHSAARPRAGDHCAVPAPEPARLRPAVAAVPSPSGLALPLRETRRLLLLLMLLADAAYRGLHHLVLCGAGLVQQAQRGRRDLRPIVRGEERFEREDLACREPRAQDRPELAAHPCLRGAGPLDRPGRAEGLQARRAHHLLERPLLPRGDHDDRLRRMGRGHRGPARARRKAEDDDERGVEGDLPVGHGHEGLVGVAERSHEMARPLGAGGIIGHDRRRWDIEFIEEHRERLLGGACGGHHQHRALGPARRRLGGRHEVLGHAPSLVQVALDQALDGRRRREGGEPPGRALRDLGQDGRERGVLGIELVGGDEADRRHPTERDHGGGEGLGDHRWRPDQDRRRSGAEESTSAGRRRRRDHAEAMGRRLRGEGARERGGRVGIRHEKEELRARRLRGEAFQRGQRELRDAGPVGRKEVRHVGGADGTRRLAWGRGHGRLGFQWRHEGRVWYTQASAEYSDFVLIPSGSPSPRSFSEVVRVHPPRLPPVGEHRGAP